VENLRFPDETQYRRLGNVFLQILYLSVLNCPAGEEKKFQHLKTRFSPKKFLEFSDLTKVHLKKLNETYYLRNKLWKQSFFLEYGLRLLRTLDDEFQTK
jgi:hypothetical protein